MKFCHIAPINVLEETAGRDAYLTLAHLVEESDTYTQFFVNQKKQNPQMLNIMDNSAFEMYKQGRPMLSPQKLISLADKINADYIALTDYPAEPYQKTIDQAKDQALEFKDAGFGTFFIPQSEIGDLKGLTYSFIQALYDPNIDYIGLSILAVPNAYGVESGNKLQRYLSRYHFISMINRQLALSGHSILSLQKLNNKKIHFLGMVDGPNEISLFNKSNIFINTWDSSAAVWAGLNSIRFDESPTGLINGKFEKEVDFHGSLSWNDLAEYNMDYIDILSDQLSSNYAMEKLG